MFYEYLCWLLGGHIYLPDDSICIYCAHIDFQRMDAQFTKRIFDRLNDPAVIAEMVKIIKAGTPAGGLDTGEGRKAENGVGNPAE